MKDATSDTFIRQKLCSIEQLLLVKQKAALCQLPVLTTDEASIYMGVSKAYLYQLTSHNKIPYSKPAGKLMYFDRQALDTWLLRNSVATTDEIEAAAATYCLNNKWSGHE